MIIRLFIPGAPGAKGRPRFTKQGHAYTPAATVRYETYLRVLMVEAMGDRSPVDLPVALRLHFVMPEPQSMRKRDRGMGMPHIRRPDMDNLEKAVLDAGNGVLFRDDALVWFVEKMKTYPTADRPDPGVHVEVILKGERDEA